MKLTRTYQEDMHAREKIRELLHTTMTKKIYTSCIIYVYNNQARDSVCVCLSAYVR